MFLFETRLKEQISANCELFLTRPLTESRAVFFPVISLTETKKVRFRNPSKVNEGLNLATSARRGSGGRGR